MQLVDPQDLRKIRNDLILKLWHERRYTQQQIATIAGCSQPTVAKVIASPESGDESGQRIVRKERRPRREG